jgi:hypothetical protein
VAATAKRDDSKGAEADPTAAPGAAAVSDWGRASRLVGVCVTQSMQHRIELQFAGPDRSQLRKGCRQRHADEMIPPAAVTQAGGAIVDARTVTGAHTKGIAVRLPLLPNQAR